MRKTAIAMAVVGALTVAANVQAANEFSALTKDTNVTNGIVEGKVSITVSASSTGYESVEEGAVGKSSVFGGVKLSDRATTTDAEVLANIVNTTVAVTSGSWDKIIGGNSFKSTPLKTGQEVLTPALETSSVTIGNGVGTVFQLAGGSHESGGNGQHVALGNGGTTAVTIANGKFGQENTKNSQATIIEQYVVAGDAIKVTVDGNSSSEVTSRLTSTSMTISGGTFNAPVVGGSMAMAYNNSGTAAAKDTIDAQVKTSTLTITGGTFNHAVTAAGYASGQTNSTKTNVTSTVETANLSVTNVDGTELHFNADIYAGGIVNAGANKTAYAVAGLAEYTSNTKDANETKVTPSSNITIDGATVQGIYGTVGLLTVNKKTVQKNSKDVDVYDSHEYTSSDTYVKTNLTLKDATATTVQLGGSSVLNVKGTSTVDTLTLDGNEVKVEGTGTLKWGDKGTGLTGTANIYGTLTTDPKGTGTFNVATGGTLVAGVLKDGKVKLSGGTLQTTSSVVFTTQNLIAETKDKVSKETTTSVVSNLTAESGTVALTDGGVYTTNTLTAMSKAAEAAKFSIKFLNATRAADDNDKSPSQMLNNIVQSTETVTATVKDNKLEVAQGESGGATIKVSSEVTTVDLATKEGSSTGTVVVTGTTSGGSLFTNSKDEAVASVTVGKGVTLQLGEVETAAETQGTLDSLVVEGGSNTETETAKLVVANMTAQVSNVTLKKNAKVSIGTSGDNSKRGELAVKTLNMEAGSEIFLDPVWTGNDSFATASFLSVASVESLKGKLVVGQNSAAALGASKAEAVAAFDKLAQQNDNFRWGENAITAALYLAQAIDVTGSEDAEITVNGNLTDSNYGSTSTSTSTSPSGGASNTVTIASRGLLAINQQAIGTGPAITGSLKLEENSVIGLVNATGEDLTLATKMAAGSSTDVRVVTDNPFVTGKLSDDKTKILAAIDAENGLGAIASTGLQAMTRRADSVLAQTIADRTSVDQDYASGISLWVDVTGERYEADKLDNNGSFKSDMGYGAFGGDFAITEDISAGAAFQYGKGTVRSSVSSIKNSIDSYGITAYGSMKFGDAKVVAEASYIKNENDITSSQTALNQSVDTDIYSFGVRGQHRFTAGQFQFVPSVGVRVSRLNTDAMKVGAVKMKKQEQTLVQVPIALRINGFEQNAGGWSLAPSVKIAYVPTFGDKEISFRGTDQTVIDTAPVQGDFGIRAQKGNLLLNASFMVGGGKDGTSSVGGKAGLKYVF